MSLDRKRDYASVHGDTAGASWAQDGLLFYEDGTVMEAHETYDAATKAKAAKRAGVKDVEEEPEPDPDHIDLRKWGLGEVDAQFPKVRSQMKAEFGASPKNTVEAVKMLVEAGVLTEDDTKRT